MELLRRHTLAASQPADRAQFAFWVREFVSCFYPGTEATYGLSLFDEHIAGLEGGPGSRRLVWAIRDGQESIGFLVATHRLDRSVKLGPVVVEPSRRSEGCAVDALEEVVAIYEAEGRPYLYATHPSKNVFIRQLASRAGWEIAGAVRGLYRDDEEVLIHRTLSQQPIRPMPTPLPIYPALSYQNRFVGKRGGSILLRVNEFDPAHDVELAARAAATAVRHMKRICYSRVPPCLASSLMADDTIRLVDGTALAVWR
jgi:hypothetical protein